ncbi:MAG: hypothetical protein Q7J60_09910 [Bradyrhizobium sp.]|nr:hypothetical protein [Bradyrhizobium sp.]
MSIDMEFTSANPSVVRSVKQRDLLNAWLRALDKGRALPLLAEYSPERIADELLDMMGYEVEGEGADARFLITQEGSRLTATYGSEHVDPARRTNRYLDDAIGPQRYARVIPSYRACLAHRRPTYSISMVQDADGKDVSYERLLLPFGTADKVEQIVGSFKAISIEGGFKVTNLMGIKSLATPVSVVRAVIDHDFVPIAALHHASDDVIEVG